MVAMGGGAVWGGVGCQLRLEAVGGGCTPAAAAFHHPPEWGRHYLPALAAVLAYSCLAASGAHLSVCSLRSAVQNDGRQMNGRPDAPVRTRARSSSRRVRPKPVSSNRMDASSIASAGVVAVDAMFAAAAHKHTLIFLPCVCVCVFPRSPGTTLTQSASAPVPGGADGGAARAAPQPAASAAAQHQKLLMSYCCTLL